MKDVLATLRPLLDKETFYIFRLPHLNFLSTFKETSKRQNKLQREYHGGILP